MWVLICLQRREQIRKYVFHLIKSDCNKSKEYLYWRILI